MRASLVVSGFRSGTDLGSGVEADDATPAAPDRSETAKLFRAHAGHGAASGRATAPRVVAMQLRREITKSGAGKLKDMVVIMKATSMMSGRTTAAALE